MQDKACFPAAIRGGVAAGREKEYVQKILWVICFNLPFCVGRFSLGGRPCPELHSSRTV